MDKISIEPDTGNPPPGNHAPVAKAAAAPLFTVWPDQTNLLIIAVDGIATEVALDGSLSSDADHDPLDFLWAHDEESTPFAAGIMVTNSFEVGFHTITLVVSDGQAAGSDMLLVEIITLGDAVDELYGVLIESEIDRKDKRPLLATLERVSESFENGRLKAGVRQLHAFQLKVRAQVSPKHSALGRRLIGASQQIIDAVDSYMDANEETPDDDNGKGGKK